MIEFVVRRKYGNVLLDRTVIRAGTQVVSVCGRCRVVVAVPPFLHPMFTYCYACTESSCSSDTLLDCLRLDLFALFSVPLKVLEIRKAFIFENNIYVDIIRVELTEKRINAMTTI